MERAFVIGDPHFREGSVRDMELFIEETLRIINENKTKADYIVVLGDIMDRHGILHQKPFHQACRLLIELSKLLPTYCLIGNHDFDIPSKYLPENHPFKVMTWTSIPNLTIVDKPKIIQGKLFCPYVPPGMFNRAIGDSVDQSVNHSVDHKGWETLTERGIGLVYAHQEFKGCHMGRIISEVGDEWPGEFGRAPFVVSGHIHDHQMVGDNIMYVGTPVQVNFGEGKKKGICIFTLKYKEGVPEQYETEWFPIRVPKKITKHIHIDALDAWVEKRFSDLMEMYNISLPKIFSKKAESRGFDSIQRITQNKDKLTDLFNKVQSDPFLDHYRLQITTSSKISNTILKNTVFKVRDLPLGVQQVFITDIPAKTGISEIDQSTERIGWLEHITDLVKGSGLKERLFMDILKHLTDKGSNNIGNDPY